jgi:hypothetical protein
MKTVSKAILAGLMTLLTACAALAGTPQKIDEFVAKTESECQNYSKEDWQKSRSEYRALLDEYKNSRKEFSQAEKEQVVRAMGRYNALLIKNGIIKSSMGVQEISALLPDFIKGLSEGLEANSEEINRSLKSIVDTNKLNSAIQSLGSALEKIFTPAE